MAINKTCITTIPSSGKTCGRPAKARTLLGDVCGIHAKAEEKRGGEVHPLPQTKSFTKGRQRVVVTPATDGSGDVAASEFDGQYNVAHRRFTGLTAQVDAERWAGFLLNPAPDTEDPRPRDNSGYLYASEHGLNWRLTECCEAATTYTGDGDHVCKACYRTVDEALGDVAVLGDAAPNPVGPVVVVLTGAEAETQVVWKNEDDYGSESFGPMVIARKGEAYSLGNQPWVNRKHAVAEAARLGIPFVEA